MYNIKSHKFNGIHWTFFIEIEGVEKYERASPGSEFWGLPTVSVAGE